MLMVQQTKQHNMITKITLDKNNLMLRIDLWWVGYRIKRKSNG